ncbi:phage minor head protein [Streptomyces chartreusis]|uniref:phage minor head protein n=1 Tax=Streptomyces chartreusis TaxID=1969 RepID=UPI002E170F3E
MDELEEALAAAEEDVAAEVRAVLEEVAEEFAADLEAATELVAARFSVSRIAGMWSRRVPRLLRRLLGVTEQAAETAAGQVDAELPEGWDDLPGRQERGEELPDGIGQYVESTEHLLRAVGDRLADVAVRELAQGVDAGEDLEALRARLLAAFAREGAQLGPGREALISTTEAARAWNTATLAAAQALTGPDRPIVKQWQTRRDSRVRDAHHDVDGFVRLLDDPFTVAGVDMQHPGDPSAPPALVCNCRCILRLQKAAEQRASAYGTQGPPRVHVLASTPPNPRYPGVRFLIAPETYCYLNDGGGHCTCDGTGCDDTPEANRFPYGAEVSHPEGLAAAATEHTGAMIALVPSAQDVERLALEDGEPGEELHCTLWFLGTAADWGEDQQRELIAGVRARASSLAGPIRAVGFGVNHWNPSSPDPAWVWAIGDDPEAGDEAATLHEARAVLAQDALEDGHNNPELPRQHTPWVAHVTAAYTTDTWPLAAMADRLGPLTFDRVRVAFAGEVTDIPLGPEEEPPMDNPTDEAQAAALPVRTWSTPGDTALAFEDTETGDGRIFAAGALYWEAGPWPLQYADEMGMGHEGAELAGAIEEYTRDGNRITGRGPLYLTQRAGYEAMTLLEQDPPAPLGVSVDLDSVDVEFVDRTLEEDEDGFLVLAASIPYASVMRLEDGGWVINASTEVEATAAGTSLARRQRLAQIITGPDGRLSAAALQAFDGAHLPLRRVRAAAGDSDSDDGVVLHSEQAGDFVIRITKARLRGATLVAMPAFDRARIVLDPPEEPEEAEAAAVDAALLAAASAPGETRQKVISYVRASPGPVGAAAVGKALGIATSTAAGHLRAAAKAGHLVRLAAGLYVGASSMPEGTGATASAAGVVDGDDQGLTDLVASAWTAMRDLPPMPAAWFAEPTEEELPPGSGGVHYAGGRIFGWVAQAGEPHAGFANRRLTIDSLGDIDTTHFLRARFLLDNGEYVKAGAFTMNAPHTADGAECDSVACQFDDTRTVAGIVTVGMNERGMWFAGAAAPWLSEWDRTVFMGCQPSYHMKKGDNGRWQLRAVLSVPVPGHSSPLLAAAVERGNLALAASAAAVLDSPDTSSGQRPDGAGRLDVLGQEANAGFLSGLRGHGPDTSGGHAPDTVAALLNDPALLDGLSAALARRETERREEVAALSAAVLAPTTTDPKGDQ